MKKYIILNISLFFLLNIAFGQVFNGGFGLELNQTRFRQHAPTITVPFDNPHNPGIGLNTYIFIDYSLSDFFTFQVAPMIGFYNTNSKVTSSYQMNIFGFRFESLYRQKRLRLGCGFEYNRLHKFLGTTERGTTDWTFFAHRRNLYGPTVSLGYTVFPNSTLYFRSSFFLHDFYSSGALDYNGNIVGPVEITPLVFSFGVEYKIDFSKLNKSKK